ncbi:MAG: hypothetical protein ACKVQA_20365 [Burkholderiales bacterium]
MRPAQRLCLTQTITDFLGETGIPITFRPLTQNTFLPGIWIEKGALVVDEGKLTQPGDLLHEAGHIAVLPASGRPHLNGQVDSDPGQEMAAIAWSWAALVRLNLAPELVFHPQGYKGASRSIVENFSQGRFFGVPLLQWYGMTLGSEPGNGLGVRPYPAMISWLRS